MFNILYLIYKEVAKLVLCLQPTQLDLPNHEHDEHYSSSQKSDINDTLLTGKSSDLFKIYYLYYICVYTDLVCQHWTLDPGNHHHHNLDTAESLIDSIGIGICLPHLPPVLPIG